MKKIIIALLAVAAISATVILWFSNPLDSLLKAAIEKFGSEMTAAAVRVGKVHISPTDGKGELSGLSLGNPRGFKTGHAFKAGRIEVALDPATVTDDAVLVHKILIDAPSISFEKGDSGSNFDAIQRNVERYLGTAQKKDEKAEAGKKMIIESLVIRNARVDYDGMIEFSLPDIELHNVGKKRGGATSAQVVKAVIAELNTQIAIALAKSAAVGAVGGVAIGIGMGVKSLLDR